MPEKHDQTAVTQAGVLGQKKKNFFIVRLYSSTLNSCTALLCTVVQHYSVQVYSSNLYSCTALLCTVVQQYSV